MKCINQQHCNEAWFYRFSIEYMVLVAMLILFLILTVLTAWGSEGRNITQAAGIQTEHRRADRNPGTRSPMAGDWSESLSIGDPDGHAMLDAMVKNWFHPQALADFFLEGTKLSYNEARPKAFFDRFPVIDY